MFKCFLKKKYRAWLELFMFAMHLFPCTLKNIVYIEQNKCLVVLTLVM